MLMSLRVSTICPPVKSMSPAFQLSPLAFTTWLLGGGVGRGAGEGEAVAAGCARVHTQGVQRALDVCSRVVQDSMQGGERPAQYERCRRAHHTDTHCC